MNTQIQQARPKERTIVVIALFTNPVLTSVSWTLLRAASPTTQAPLFFFFLVFHLIFFQSPFCFQIFSLTGKVTGWVGGLALSKPPFPQTKGPVVVSKRSETDRKCHHVTGIHRCLWACGKCLCGLPEASFCTCPCKGEQRASPEPLSSFCCRLMADGDSRWGQRGKRRWQQWAAPPASRETPSSHPRSSLGSAPPASSRFDAQTTSALVVPECFSVLRGLMWELTPWVFKSPHTLKDTYKIVCFYVLFGWRRADLLYRVSSRCTAKWCNYMYMCIFFYFLFFPMMDYYRILDIVPCTLQ